MTPAFTGPCDVTRAGRKIIEWEAIIPGGTYRLIVDEFDDIWLRDENDDVGIQLDDADLGPLAAMLTDAQQHLTGGQR